MTENNGAAVFENRNAPYAITYYYLNPRAGEEGKREVPVDIGMLDSEPDSRAGILYGFQDNPRSYFMFTVGGDRSVNLQFFDQGNMQWMQGANAWWQQASGTFPRPTPANGSASAGGGKSIGDIIHEG